MTQWSLMTARGRSRTGGGRQQQVTAVHAFVVVISHVLLLDCNALDQLPSAFILLTLLSALLVTFHIRTIRTFQHSRLFPANCIPLKTGITPSMIRISLSSIIIR